MVTAESLLGQLRATSKADTDSLTNPYSQERAVDNSGAVADDRHWLVSRYGFTNDAVIDGIAIGVHSIRTADGDIAAACLLDTVDATQEVEPAISLDSFVVGSLGSLSVAA